MSEDSLSQNTVLSTNQNNVSVVFSLQESSVLYSDRRFLTKPVATKEQLEFLGVNPKWQEYIRQLDTYDNLVLFHYITTVDSNGNINEEPMEFIGHVRGIILDVSDTELHFVCKSFGYTPEISFEEFQKNIGTFKDDYTVNPCKEGTILRTFWHNDIFLVSTHRKINAENNRWSSKLTFGQMIREINPDFFTSESGPNYEVCNVWLLQHNQNKQMYKIKENKLVFLGEYSIYNNAFYVEENEEYSVNSVKDLVQHRDADRYGAILYYNGNSVKVVSKEYLQLRKVRGNEPNLGKRYLQLHGTSDQTVLRMLFTEAEEDYKKADQRIMNLVCYLHRLYIYRFVNKVYTELPKEEHVLLMKCHNLYKNDSIVITQEVVKNVVFKTPFYHLKKILYRIERDPKEIKEEDSNNYLDE